MPTASASASCVRPDESLTPEDYERARRLLMRRDPVLGGIVKQIGPCGLAARQRNDHLTALIGAIVSQQLSTKAAATIFGRFVALFPGGEIPGASAIDGISAEALRGVGLSGQKIGYLRDLCARIADGRLELEALDTLTDDEVVERLTAVKGFGRWTAEMFLIFNLLRPNVLPLDDPGLIQGISQNYFSGEPVSRSDAREVSANWEPWRTVATWYLWRSLDPVAVE